MHWHPAVLLWVIPLPFQEILKFTISKTYSRWNIPGKLVNFRCQEKQVELMVEIPWLEDHGKLLYLRDMEGRSNVGVMR